jgi:hypothetical protein
MYAYGIGFFNPFARSGLMVKVYKCSFFASSVAKISGQIGRQRTFAYATFLAGN